jgi:hypothetical protein
LPTAAVIARHRCISAASSRPVSRAAITASFSTRPDAAWPSGQKLIPQDAQVRSYPSVERDQLVWLWMGDPALADPARIVDFGKQDDEHSMMPARRIGMPKIARIVGDEDEIAVR